MTKTKKWMIKNCRPEKVFWLRDGRTLKNITEMLNALKKMDDGLFKYHVNEQKNDFANWIKDIFKQVELAQKIAPILEKGTYIAMIEETITPKKKVSKKKKK